MRPDPNAPQTWQQVLLEVEHCSNAYLRGLNTADLAEVTQQFVQWWLTARGKGTVQLVTDGWDMFNVGHLLSTGLERTDDPAVFKDDEEALAHVVRMSMDMDGSTVRRQVAGAAVLLHQLANEARRRAWGEGSHNLRIAPEPGQRPVPVQPDYPDEVTKEQLDAIQQLIYDRAGGRPTLRAIGKPGW